MEATPQHLLDCVALVYDDLLMRPDFVLEVMKANGLMDLIQIGRIRKKKKYEFYDLAMTIPTRSGPFEDGRMENVRFLLADVPQRVWLLSAGALCIVKPNCTKPGVTLSVAKSHKSRHVFATAGREYDKQLARPRDSRLRRIKTGSLSHTKVETDARNSWEEKISGTWQISWVF
ncbi:hypothetical protein AVEN_77778-1 [Araneus ventricosus]|uniref:Uncharacterized protein n=1 Tax=Araneus ventricosus TaxID=182803 RepID=A0A4Y2RVH7_ARAVE|nr:hypothetical protein AVEN_77778-1 [Araneus ventricosus]